jgi:uncharacterized protein DUF5996
MEALARLGVDVAISAKPSEVADPIPFAEDRTHHSYDPDAVHRFFQVLSRVDTVFKEHRARFWGKAPPVQFFWGSFDLAVVLFSGRPAAPPAEAGTIMRHGATAEQIEGGFWPGHDQYPRAAFFAYSYPKPDDVETAPIRPTEARWDDQLGEFVLDYDAVRTAPEPKRAILDFLESTYDANASRLGWDTDLMRK